MPPPQAVTLLRKSDRTDLDAAQARRHSSRYAQKCRDWLSQYLSAMGPSTEFCKLRAVCDSIVAFTTSLPKNNTLFLDINVVNSVLANTPISKAPLDIVTQAKS